MADAPSIQHAQKVCTKCGLPGEFPPLRSARDGLSSWCRKCSQRATDDWRNRNPDKTASYRQRGRLRRYGLDQAAYDRLLDLQGGGCAICGTIDCYVGVTKIELAIDHDHNCCPGGISCGKCVRGLLCNRCNSVLGYFGDNPELFRKALNYLEEDRTL